MMNAGQMESQILQNSSTLQTSSPSSTSDAITPNQVYELTYLKFVPSTQDFLVESRLVSNGAIFKVSRKYDDFLLLNANLVASSEPSTIMPPLPENFEPGEKVLPSEQVMIIKTGNIDHRDVEEFSLFLKAVLRHTKLGCTKFVEDFFIENNLKFPVPKLEKRKSNLLSKFSASSPSKRIVTQTRDIDEFYEKQRFFIISHDAKLQVCKGDFENVLIGNRKLCNVLSHFATSVTAALVVKEEQNSEMISFMKSFCTAFENFRVHLDLSANLAYQHLGVILQYLFLYNLTFKEMIAQRSELMTKYEGAVKTLQKNAESKHLDRYKDEKDKAEKEVEDFSQNGRKEVEMFHDFRNTFMIIALNDYKRNQLVMARKTVNILRASIATLKQL